ncbi:MAG: hypothetical protein ACREPT_03380 [Rudaea sp.]
MSRETRTARLTILIDPNKKAVFEDLCRLEDVTPSQVIRRLIRTYIEQKLGRPWKPGERPSVPSPIARDIGAAERKRSQTKKSR